jgi:drug/metabolite transporter (DMT)-like permease
MPPATLIARLIGPVFAVIGVAILVNTPYYVELTAEASHVPTLIYIYGLLVLAVGIAMLNFHRAWTRDWRVIVTILGWLFVIGGVIRILLPQAVERLAPTMFGSPAGLIAAGVIVFVVGGYLTFEGYRPWR